MALTHYDREEETLIAYFKQMLSEEVEALETEPEEAAKPQVEAAAPESVPSAPVAQTDSTPAEVQPQPEPQEQPQAAELPEEQSVSSTGQSEEPAVKVLSAEEAANLAMIEAAKAQEEQQAESRAEPETVEAVQPEAQQENPEDDAYSESEYEEQDYERDEYAQDEDYGYTREPQREMAAYAQDQRPYATPSSLQSLLEQVPAPAVQTATAEAEPQVAVAEAEPEVAVAAAEPEVQTAEAQAEVKAAEDTQIVQAVKTEAPALPDGLQWENIETPNEFQALFFLARGVRFAVPLVDLGGIYECSNVTSLFGKPAWYKGISDVRGRKINVVDTLKWVKPDVKVDSEFKYIILLGDSLWSICCDELEGNRYLNKENVKWRKNAGNRPWLAGIVKKEMCALLHVNALVTMFGQGFDLKTLQE